MGFYDFPHTRNYDSDLGYLIKRFKELDEKYGNIEVDYKKYTDEKVAEALDSFRIELAATVSRLEKEYTDFNKIVQSELTEFNNKLDDFEIRIQQAEVSAQAYTDNSIAQYDTRIKEYIGNELIDVKVINYFTGEKVSVQEMLDYLAHFHLSNAISYTQLAGRNINYISFIGLNMSYSDLALNGGTIIPQN